MTTKFNMTRDINGYNGFGLPDADDKFQMSLAANVEQTVTVPSNQDNWIAIFSYSPGSNIWVAFNTTAVVATGSATSTHSSLNPAGRKLKKGDVIHLITSDTTNPQVGIELYAIDPYVN